MIDVRSSACLLLVVHGVHSGSSLIIIGVADESETAAAASITVLDDGLKKKMVLDDVNDERQEEATHSILDNAEFLEALAQTVVVCVPGKTARYDGLVGRDWKIYFGALTQ